MQIKSLGLTITWIKAFCAYETYSNAHDVSTDLYLTSSTYLHILRLWIQGGPTYGHLLH